jgi:hypothetical protein
MEEAPRTKKSSSWGKIPEWVVKAFKDEGWTWGGDFKSRKDLQHFQAASGY